LNYECKQILWQINEIKEHQKWNKTGKVNIKNLPLKDIISLSHAEQRRRKIQEKLAAPKEKVIFKPQNEISPISISEKTTEPKKPKLLQQIQEQEKKEQLKKEKEEEIRKEVKDIRLQKIKAKQEKLKAIEQQRKAEDELINQANSYLDQANRDIKVKKYDEAKELYTQSIKIFTSLGWNDQVRTLNQELRNIEIYKKEDARKEYLAQQRKIESEQKFQKRVSSVINEKERLLEKNGIGRTVLPPEIKLKLDKARFTKEKAEKEEKVANLGRAVARYQYALELYESIPPEYLDLSEEITFIKQKISEIKEKT
jgi:tetratricopeptide (TPR) repeat protein